MSDYLIPQSWVVPLIAASLPCSDAEAQRLLDDGIIHDVESFSREALRRDLKRFERYGDISGETETRNAL